MNKISTNLLVLKGCFALMILGCVLLISVFALRIHHGRKMDKIWDKYEKDMAELHASY